MKIFESSLTSTLLSREILQLTGLVGIAYFAYMELYNYFFVAIAFGMFLVYVSHHVGLHRYFTHRSFETNKFWHVFLCLIAPLMCVGSPIGYAAAHRAHHAYSDKELDPHSPALGFFNVAMTRWNYKGVHLKFFANLKDSWILFSHNWYLLIIIIFCIMLVIVDPLLLMAYGVSLIYAKICAVSTNYFCHLPLSNVNYRNFNTNDNSQNNLINGWLVGEWHNNHHADPGNWNQRVKWWEWDIPSMVIKAIKK